MAAAWGAGHGGLGTVCIVFATLCKSKLTIQFKICIKKPKHFPLCNRGHSSLIKSYEWAVVELSPLGLIKATDFRVFCKWRGETHGRTPRDTGGLQRVCEVRFETAELTCLAQTPPATPVPEEGLGD